MANEIETAATVVCFTCSGEGQTFDDAGPRVCPDCEGDGRMPPRYQLVERRLFAIERTLQRRDREAQMEITWLIHELRRSRDALTRILTRTLDENATDPVAQEVKVMLIDALGMYEPEPG